MADLCIFGNDDIEKDMKKIENELNWKNVISVQYSKLLESVITPVRRKFIGDERGTEMEIKVKNGVNLFGYYYESMDKNADTCAVYVHGNGYENGGNHGEVLPLLKELLKTMDVFSFDRRGCGKSNGTYVTFGVLEKYDLQIIVKLMKARKKRIVLMGKGIGASTIVQYLHHCWEEKTCIAERKYTVSLDEAQRKGLVLASRGYFQKVVYVAEVCSMGEIRRGDTVLSINGVKIQTFGRNCMNAVMQRGKLELELSTNRMDPQDADYIDAVVLHTPFDNARSMMDNVAKLASQQGVHVPYPVAAVLKQKLKNDIKRLAGIDIQDIQPDKISTKCTTKAMFLVANQSVIIKPSSSQSVFRQYGGQKSLMMLPRQYHDPVPEDAVLQVAAFCSDKAERTSSTM